MKRKLEIEGVMPAPISDADAATRVKKFEEAEPKQRAYWEMVRREILAFNADRQVHRR